MALASAALESLVIEGYELRELTPGGANWDDIIELYGAVHYYDSWERLSILLDRDRYDELLAESPVKPAQIARGHFQNDKEATFVGWYSESIYAYAVLKKVILMPGLIPALGVMQLFTVRNPDPHFASELVDAIERYAKVLDVRVVRYHFIRHTFPVQEIVEARGAFLVSTTLDQLLSE